MDDKTRKYIEGVLSRVFVTELEKDLLMNAFDFVYMQGSQQGLRVGKNICIEAIRGEKQKEVKI